MYSTELMMQCLKQIFSTIILPETSYFIRRSNGITFCYSVDGKMLYIDLPSKQSAAQFLFENGIIDYFKQDGDDTLLYRKAFYFTADHKGRPVMVQHYVPVKWEELTFSKKDVQMFAAKDVWSRVK